MPAVTRFAAFKYKPEVTDEQKRDVVDRLIVLYEVNSHLVNVGPVGKRSWKIHYSLELEYRVLGGRNNNLEGADKGFDVCFTVEFKVCSTSASRGGELCIEGTLQSIEARDEFVPEKNHVVYKVCGRSASFEQRLRTDIVTT